MEIHVKTFVCSQEFIVSVEWLTHDIANPLAANLQEVVENYTHDIHYFSGSSHIHTWSQQHSQVGIRLGIWT
jgi:hypothetical protein